jgi:hypothetical protein
MSFLILVFFAFLVATFAKSQGQSFLLWLLISGLFTPILGFIGLMGYLKFNEYQ